MTFIERAIALIIAFIFSPLFFILAFYTFLNAGYPIFFVQKKYGKNEEIFGMYKFRTMKRGTPNIATQNFDDSQSFLIKNLQFMRKYSLDETPQLINIIRGEMSFIGPRPGMISNENELFQLRREKNIFKLKPGITGWAQVNGRDSNEFKEKVALDEYYLNNKSLLLDFKILIKTIIIVFSAKVKH